MSGYPGQSPYTLLQESATQPGSRTPNGTFGYGVPILTRLLQAGSYPVPTASISAPADNASVSTGQKGRLPAAAMPMARATKPTLDWNFGSGSGIADSSQAKPSVTFKNTGSYTVTLTCTGCERLRHGEHHRQGRGPFGRRRRSGLLSHAGPGLGFAAA